MKASFVDLHFDAEMGITGLLPNLKDIQNPVSLQKFEGCTLGIDGYAWLHRAACSCAADLALGNMTTKYLQFFIKKFAMLKHFKIKPYLVFDGDGIPVKKGTESKRREKRQENRAIAERLWHAGQTRNALEYFQKCVDITPEMAKCVIDYCRNNGIQYVVAPFEADSQMVYLEKHGFIDGIISEDSDLLVFGCHRLITKLNDHGECLEICSDDYPKLSNKFPLGKLTPQEVITMVCLSGCDYTDGIPRIGLIKAIKLVQLHRTIEKVLLHLKREGKVKIPESFLEEYELASFAFQYQRVFCPRAGKIVTLNPIPRNYAESLSEVRQTKVFKCLGMVIHKATKIKQVVIYDDEIDHETHKRIALGYLCPYDFNKQLVSREIKIQLTSKSESAIDDKRSTMGTKSIDNFFTKTEGRPLRNTVNRVLKPAVVTTKGIDKLRDVLKRRKLGVRNSNIPNNTTSSKFFERKSSNIKSIASSQTVSHVYSPDNLTELFDVNDVSNLSMTQADDKSVDENIGGTQSNINIIGEKKVVVDDQRKGDNLSMIISSDTGDDCETEVPESELSTQIPSSLTYMTSLASRSDNPISSSSSDILDTEHNIDLMNDLNIDAIASDKISNYANADENLQWEEPRSTVKASLLDLDQYRYKEIWDVPSGIRGKESIRRGIVRSLNTDSQNTSAATVNLSTETKSFARQPLQSKSINKTSSIGSNSGSPKYSAFKSSPKTSMRKHSAISDIIKNNKADYSTKGATRSLTVDVIAAAKDHQFEAMNNTSQSVSCEGEIVLQRTNKRSKSLLSQYAYKGN